MWMIVVGTYSPSPLHYSREWRNPNKGRRGKRSANINIEYYKSLVFASLQRLTWSRRLKQMLQIQSQSFRFQQHTGPVISTRH
jgi:hypothetical protein